MGRINLLIFVELPGGASSYLFDRISQFLDHNFLTDIFMGNPEIYQEVIIKKMAAGTVPDIMKEGGYPKYFLDKRLRGASLFDYLL